MKKFTKNEKTIFLAMLKDYSDTLGNRGCNDYAVENTDENWLLYKRVMRECTNEEVSESRRPKATGKIVFYDWMLLAYFQGKLELE